MDKLYIDSNESGPASALYLPVAEVALSPGNLMMSSLEQVLKEIGPLPQGTLFLGQAEDDLPILLNMHDPAPGPILLVGRESLGRTPFLRCIARFVISSYGSHQIQFGVITSRVEEWPDAITGSSHCVGVFASNQSGARQFVQSLELWLHRSGMPRQPVLLLVDDFDELLGWDERTLASLREILTCGPQKRVWPIMTLDSALYLSVRAWLSLFRTQLLQDGLVLDDLEGIVQVPPGTWSLPICSPLFMFKKQAERIRFWIPS